MKLAKSLLLGTTAGIVAVSAAGAADLPVRKAAPVEYVRVCSEHGKGFFYVPGSDTCIMIGGRVRGDTQFNESFNRNRDSVSFGVQARVHLDVRNNTPYGTVRAYLRYALTRSMSGWNTSGDYPRGTGGPGNGGGVDLAFIQFAGLTAGRIQSFFDMYADNYNFAAIRNSDTKTQALGYTFTFGNGFSLTAAMEDGNERRMSGQWSAGNWSGLGNDWGGYGGYNPVLNADGVNIAHGQYTYFPGGNSYRWAGQTAPDGVVSLNVTQGWGAAQLAAAIHQIRPAFDGPTGPNYLHKDTDYGYAVKAAAKFNLPMIAPGDELWLEAVYADGALGYTGANLYGWNPNLGIAGITDAYVDASGSIKRTKGFSAMVDFLHYWTPSIRQNLFASYLRVDYGRDASIPYVADTIPGLGGFNAGYIDTTEWRVGTNLIWSPIKNFDIGVEVLYTRVDPKGRVLYTNNGGVAKLVSSEDQWQGRLRVQRDF